MKPFLAIVSLTLKAMIRNRLLPLLAVALLAIIFTLPMMVRDLGSAKIFTQVTLTYSLSLVTLVLGLATLWISCGSLSRDIADSHLQVVTTKPIARWQIWLGKWAGIVLANAILLAISGLAILTMLEWRARSLAATSTSFVPVAGHRTQTISPASFQFFAVWRLLPRAVAYWPANFT